MVLKAHEPVRALMLWFLLCLAAAASPIVDGADFDPVSGYRISHYRAPVPAPPEGVRKIDVHEALELSRHGNALFIDVTPAEGGRREEATGLWVLAEVHKTIPGARWFPEAGRGRLENATEAWFLGGVARLSHGRQGQPVVVFCLADCWMSWNASLRLRRAGHRDVRWLGDGVDGWRDLGLPLTNGRPEN